MQAFAQTFLQKVLKISAPTASQVLPISPDLPYKNQINIAFANIKFKKLQAHPLST